MPDQVLVDSYSLRLLLRLPLVGLATKNFVLGTGFCFLNALS